MSYYKCTSHTSFSHAHIYHHIDLWLRGAESMLHAIEFRYILLSRLFSFILWIFYTHFDIILHPHGCRSKNIPLFVNLFAMYLEEFILHMVIWFAIRARIQNIFCLFPKWRKFIQKMGKIILHFFLHREGFPSPSYWFCCLWFGVLCLVLSWNWNTQILLNFELEYIENTLQFYK